MFRIYLENQEEDFFTTNSIEISRFSAVAAHQQEMMFKDFNRNIKA